MATLLAAGRPVGFHPGLFFIPLALIAYYLFAYLRLGRRRALGSIMPRNEPPTSLSPAAVRYLLVSAADGRRVAAVLAQLAIRRSISVKQKSGRYQISRLPADPEVEKQFATEEARILEMLFEDTNPVTLNPADTDDLKRYTLAIEGALLKRLGDSYARWHYGWIALGVIASLVAGLVSVHFLQGEGESSLFMFAWVIFWFSLLLAIVFAVVVFPVARAIFRDIFEWRRILLAFGLIVFLGLAAHGFTSHRFTREVPLDLIAMLVALAFLNVGAAPLPKTYTQLGRQALAEIECFRLYLQKVEQDQYDRLNQPKVTVESRGEFLPYAIALEVKVTWGDRLCDIFL
jgi:hypothetical protein